MSDQSFPHPAWLTVKRGAAPLIVSMPHTGTELQGLEERFASPWLARKDADWYVEKLYAFASRLGATLIRTTVSRTVIDVNRDPSGASLYPGQATTELCPTTTFDGEPLYRDGQNPSADEVAERRAAYFDPYHATLRAEADRLRKQWPRIVVYDAHSIRSQVPRLFDGTLPQFNIGTNGGVTADAALTSRVSEICGETGLPWVVNGRFRGGYITRAMGQPANGVHAIQMELATRGYLREVPGPVAPENWPVAYDDDFAAPLRAALTRVLEACLAFAQAS